MLLSQADDLGSGQRKVSGQIGGNEVDISSNIAAEAASAKGAYRLACPGWPC
jgi:hypothetical protein